MRHFLPFRQSDKLERLNQNANRKIENSVQVLEQQLPNGVISTYEIPGPILASFGVKRETNLILMLPSYMSRLTIIIFLTFKLPRVASLFWFKLQYRHLFLIEFQMQNQ